MQVAVIGAGVSGLSTAITLLEAGCSVELFAEKTYDKSVSAVAAAIWLPFNLGPQEMVNRLAKKTFLIFEKMAFNKNKVVQMTQLEIWVKDEQPDWISALPENRLSPIINKKSPVSTGFGFLVDVPMIDTPLYLAYLWQRFLKEGGTFHQLRINEFSSIRSDVDWLVNCTGLGARDLCKDQQLFPIKGQLIKLSKQDINPMIIDFPLPGSSDQLFYLLKRSDGLIIGGSATVDDWSEELDARQSQAIYERALNFYPNLKNSDLLGELTGLRPGRKSLRLEKEGKIIHNYGHGGGGYTVSWGCAEKVLNLIQEKEP